MGNLRGLHTSITHAHPEPLDAQQSGNLSSSTPRPLPSSPIRDAVISSVVPTLTPFLIDLCRKTFGCDPLIADANVETGISFPFDPENLGSDRRVNVTAGANKYGFPLIIVDLGTATTLDVVDDRGRYVGGVILPGIHTATEALILRTALLPRFSLERPESIIGQNTVAGLQAG